MAAVEVTVGVDSGMQPGFGRRAVACWAVGSPLISGALISGVLFGGALFGGALAAAATGELTPRVWVENDSIQGHRANDRTVWDDPTETGSQESGSQESGSQESKPLEQLGWLIGQWKTDARAEIPAQAEGRWSPDGHFLLLDYQVSPPGGPTISSSDRIAWDPVGKSFRSWTFRGDGGFGQANWVARDQGWMIRYSGIHGDGRPFSATLMLSQGESQKLNLSAIERWVGEDSQPDLKLELIHQAAAALAAEEIEGPVWELIRLASGPVRERNRPTLRLSQGEVEAFGGINRIGGRYQRKDSALSFRELVSTLMGGSDADSEQEQEFSAMLESVTRAEVKEGELLLYEEDQEVARFRRRPADAHDTAQNPDPFTEVVDKTWELFELKGGAVDGDDPPTLKFESGRVDGFGGINRLSGSYNQTQGALTFGPLRATRKGGPPAAMRLEGQFANILSQVDRFEIQDGRLVLFGNNEVLAKLRRLP
jgi:heat shock protein HslJ